MKLTMDALGGDVEVRLVAGTMYMKSPAMGDLWVSIPLDDPNSPLGAIGGQFDVRQQLEVFAKAVTSATFTGAEDVDGESLDHYTATSTPRSCSRACRPRRPVRRTFPTR